MTVNGYTIAPGVDLSYADLSRRVLSDADLTGADLTGADLSGSILWRADFTGAILHNVNFTYADFCGTVLTSDQLMWLTLTRQITPIQAAGCKLSKTKGKLLIDSV